jgi:zeaxanthin glucosyltransferase
MRSLHIACMCDAGPSHVMAFKAIGRELQARGHRVTFFQAAELASQFPTAEGMGFSPLANHGFSVEGYVRLVAQQQGVSIRNFLNYAMKSAQMWCEEAPRALEAAGVEGAMVDISEPGAATAAEAAGLPYVTVSNALPLHSEPDVPPDFLPWEYRDAWWARLRNRMGYAIRDAMVAPLHRVLNRYRGEWNLRPYRSPDDSFSQMAQVTQLVAEFDLPRKRTPAYFHYVGPYRREAEKNIAFPWDRLDGRPLIYASLGNVFGGRTDLWKAIVEGCSHLGAQLVVSTGGRQVRLPHVAESGIQVSYAPQVALLRRAALAITHAGLNSVMEAAAAGVPVIAIPITGDQFGVGARIAYSGIGEVVTAAKCNAARIAAAGRKVLSTGTYRGRTAMIGWAIEKTRGAADAAAIVEQALITKRPVLRQRFVGSEQRRLEAQKGS